ncbi:uncharacterized protein LOC133314537 [Gastrolobium bilobum]|uniref:uncharacterized protein LOC133314537 n=1 Tax=Gastrolobium bilobum TaxID=150636 RepID=UPI002AB2800E|nr:uncharacterized protein LOC133314537 [Gastrolobium bilobum]
MLNPFVCGTFHQEAEDGPCSSPKKSKRKDSRDNNPFSTRGLDKFSALLADLDQRRQKVYSQMSPQDISLVRFAYSNTDDFVPIVVKVKNKDQKRHKSEELKARHLITPLLDRPIEKSTTSAEATASIEERKQPKKNISTFSWDMLMKRPSFYVPAVMILILVFLTVFGRSVATLCTCVMWYVVPTLNDISKPPRKSTKKKKKKDNYVIGLSEKKMVTHEGLLSPTSGDSRASNDHKSSGKHSHQKSW